MSVSQLGYLRLQSARIPEWRHLSEDIFGLEVKQDGGTLNIRMDERAFRIRISEGLDEQVLAIGWETPNRQAFIETIERVRAAGIDVQQLSDEASTQRGVQGIATFVDPGGFQCELYYGAGVVPGPVRFGREISGFLAGKLGLGHAVLVVEDPDAVVAFYTDVLGFKVSDYIEFSGAFMTFLHCNPRHHSLAILAPAFGYEAGDLMHFMIETLSLDDVGTGYEMVCEEKLPVTLSLGRHSNDLMTSFYVNSPSGFDVEYGFGGRLIEDEDSWDVVRYKTPKIWGHNLSVAG
jgi:2,3-dihydroxybiphenyl 1,2-dioxygenase